MTPENGPPQATPPRIVIELTRDGQIHVNGPLHDPLLCFGMLEIAKDVVRQAGQKRQQALIQVPQLGGKPI